MAQNVSPAPKQGISGREVLFGAVGVLLGLLVLSGVWLAVGRNTQKQLPTLSEVAPYAAPTFALKNLDGSDVRLADYRGKVVLLNFWGSWCEPCKEETPALQASYEKLKQDGFVVIGVDLMNVERINNRTIDHVRQFARFYGVTYPLALDDNGSVGQAYNVTPIPTSFFIDQDGKVRYIRVGQLNAREVEQAFRRLQAERG